MHRVPQGCGHPEMKRGPRAETCSPWPSPGLQHQPEASNINGAAEELKITLPPRELTQIWPAPKLGLDPEPWPAHCWGQIQPLPLLQAALPS